MPDALSFPRLQGQKQPFTQAEVNRLDVHLRATGNHRDLALLWVGIDSFLRGGDLLQLTVGDVIGVNGVVRHQFFWRQAKTEDGVCIALSQTAKEAVEAWVIASGKTPVDSLFTRRRGSQSQPISTNALRRIVKAWARYLNLNETDYSSHSLRRTKAAYLYGEGVRLEFLQLLLGHASIRNTTKYLGIDQAQALNLAREHDLRWPDSVP